MPRTLLITLFFCTILVIPCSSCQLPTEANPISICAFCSAVHAGMRLMIHGSNKYDTERGVYSIDFDFHCDTLENETFDHDDCFDGLNIPGANTIETGVWRWYILERRLQAGTNCTFTAILKDLWGEKLPELHTFCSIKENVSECLVTPGTMCSGKPGDLQCSCDCGHGFTTHNTSVGFHCTNVDECSSEMHSCTNESDCVDTEGSYWCNQTNDELGNQSILGPDSSNRPCATADEATIPREAVITTTFDNIPDASSPSFYSPQSITTTSDNSTIFIAKKEEPNSSVLVALTIVPLLTLSAFVVVLTALALKRYLSKSGKTKLKPLHCSEQFDPEYNPVAIDKTTTTKISLESILNSLHDLDMHAINESNSNQETESCLSSVTCELEEVNNLMSEGEQSSICSQVLDGTTIEPQSTMTVDVTTKNKHKSNTTYCQPMHISTSYQPQVSSDTGYAQLHLDINRGHNASQTFSTLYHHAENSLTDHAPRPFNRMNSLSSGYASPTTPLELGCYHNHTKESCGDDPSDAQTFQWKVDLYLKNGSFLPHHNDYSITAPVYFEFPQCEKK